MYIEIPPIQNLENIIETFWFFDGNETNRILPDGSMDIIFSFDGSVPKVFGIATRYNDISFMKKTQLLGARFHPGMFQMVSKTPLHELKNEVIDATLLFPDIGKDFMEKYIKDISISEKISLVENFLMQCIQPQNQDTKITLSCLQDIQQANGNISISAMMRKYTLSERTLERKFKEQIGVTMKEMARVIRFKETVKVLKSGLIEDFSRSSTTFGYYDQSHLYNEFEIFSGKSPREFI